MHTYIHIGRIGVHMHACMLVFLYVEMVNGCTLCILPHPPTPSPLPHAGLSTGGEGDDHTRAIVGKA